MHAQPFRTSVLGECLHRVAQAPCRNRRIVSKRPPAMSSAKMTANLEMQSFAARLNTFQTAHQLSKRRASSQQSKKRGGGNAVEWPHERPGGEEVCTQHANPRSYLASWYGMLTCDVTARTRRLLLPPCPGQHRQRAMLPLRHQARRLGSGRRRLG